MGGSYAHRKGIDLRARDEFLRLVRIRVRILSLSVVQIIFLAAYLAEFALNRHIARVADIGDRFCQRDVVLERLLRSIVHNRCISGTEGCACQIEAVAVVQMADHRNLRPLRCRADICVIEVKSRIL